MYGGPAFSEAMLCQHLASRCDLVVLAPRGRVDPDFVAEYGLKVMEYTLADCLAARLNASHPLSQVFQKAEVIHLNGHWQLVNWGLCGLARQSKIPYVLHPRGMMLVGHRRRWLKRLFNLLIGNRLVQGAGRVIALSDFETRHFVPYPIKTGQVAVVPNSVEAPAQINTGLVAEKDFFLYFGRIESRKNLLFLLDAFADYRKAGGTCQLLLIGPVEHGYDIPVRERMAALKLEGVAHLLPPVYDEKKWAYLAKARGVIYPAKEEPFGRVPFEALAAGTPPLVPEHSGGAEYLANLLPMSTYPDDDGAALKNRLLEFDQHRSEWESEVAKARQWVASQLDPQALAGRFVEIYQALVREGLQQLR